MCDKPHGCKGSYSVTVQSLLALGLFASGLGNKEGYHLLLVEWPQPGEDLVSSWLWLKWYRKISWKFHSCAV